MHLTIAAMEAEIKLDATTQSHVATRCEHAARAQDHLQRRCQRTDTNRTQRCKVRSGVFLECVLEAMRAMMPTKLSSMNVWVLRGFNLELIM